MDVQDPWAGQENTTYSFEEFVNPSECKSELEKKRDQLKLETDCFENAECFLELQGLQDKRNVDDIRLCAKLLQERRLCGIRMKYALKDLAVHCVKLRKKRSALDQENH